eukprot:scaffold8.g1448.t1
MRRVASWRGAGIAPRHIPPASPRRPTRAPRAAASAGDSGAPTFLAGSFLDSPLFDNKQLAQREVLRAFFCSTSTAEQAGILATAAARGPDILDTSTCLDLLCHAAEMQIKGLAEADAEAKGAVLRSIVSRLEPALPGLAPPQLGALLWSLAVAGQAADWTDALLDGVAARELERGHMRSYSTKARERARELRERAGEQELSSIMFALGRLVCAHDPGVQAYASALVGELVARLEGQPYVRGALSSTDMADLASAAARLYGARGGAAALGQPDAAAAAPPQPAAPALAAAAEAPAAGAPAAAAEVPEAVDAMLRVLGSEVRRQLANKNSLVSPFTPSDLVRFLQSYAALGHRSSPAMLDVLSSWVVQRIRSKHMNAVSRPRDLAGLLEAYADLGHASVAVPELLAAAGEQLRRLAATQHDRLAAERGPAAAAQGEGAAPPAAAAGAPAAAPLQQEELLPLEHYNSILASHLRLGYAPPPLLLHALAPAVVRQLPASVPADAAQHLHLLSHVPGCAPGRGVVGMLLARAEGGGPGALAAEGLAQARADAARLGWRA